MKTIRILRLQACSHFPNYFGAYIDNYIHNQNENLFFLLYKHIVLPQLCG